MGLKQKMRRRGNEIRDGGNPRGIPDGDSGLAMNFKTDTFRNDRNGLDDTLP